MRITYRDGKYYYEGNDINQFVPIENKKGQTGCYYDENKYMSYVEPKGENSLIVLDKSFQEYFDKIDKTDWYFAVGTRNLYQFEVRGTEWKLLSDKAEDSPYHYLQPAIKYPDACWLIHKDGSHHLFKVVDHVYTEIDCGDSEEEFKKDDRLKKLKELDGNPMPMPGKISCISVIVKSV